VQNLLPDVGEEEVVAVVVLVVLPLDVHAKFVLVDLVFDDARHVVAAFTQFFDEVDSMLQFLPLVFALGVLVEFHLHLLFVLLPVFDFDVFLVADRDFLVYVFNHFVEVIQNDVLGVQIAGLQTSQKPGEVVGVDFTTLVVIIHVLTELLHLLHTQVENPLDQLFEVQVVLLFAHLEPLEHLFNHPRGELLAEPQLERTIGDFVH